MSTADAGVRIILADDHRMFRDGLRAMLAEQDGFEVVADTGDGRTAVRLAAELGADVVVMDVTMPGLNGIEATRQLRGRQPAARVVGLSMHADREFVTAMLAAGACGYLLKDCPFGELVAAVRAAAAGEVYLSPKVAGVVVTGCLNGNGNGNGHGHGNGHAVHGGGRPSGGALTPREREVLQLVAEGKSSKEIAAMLGLSAKTVDTHRRQVMEKLGLYSVAELTHYAIREGMTTLH